MDARRNADMGDRVVSACGDISTSKLRVDVELGGNKCAESGVWKLGSVHEGICKVSAALRGLYVGGIYVLPAFVTSTGLLRAQTSFDLLLHSCKMVRRDVSQIWESTCCLT